MDSLNFGWPQIIYTALMLFALGVMCAHHGEWRQYHFGQALISAAISFTLLYFGGFFS